MSQENILNNATTTAEEALQIVSQFFGKEWPSTSLEDVTITKMTNGYSSTLHLVQRSSPAVSEPSRVLLRQQTGLFSNVDELLQLSQALQAIVYHEMGERGWGPTLYGVADGIRVEEYIPSRTLTAADCTDPAIVKDIARAYARMHSLSFPLVKNLNIRYAGHFKDYADIKLQWDEKVRLLRSTGVPDCDYLADHFFDVNLEQDLKWLLEIAKTHDFKISICQCDPNFLNVLVRDDSMDDGNSDGKIMLVDYECTCYNYRGFDLGGHFVNQMMNWKGKETKLPGSPYPDKEQRQRFLAFYLQAIVEDGRELTEIDKIDHLMLEADIGSLMYLCYMLILMMKYVDKFIPDPTMLMAVRFLFDFYQKHKETVRGSIP